MKAYFSSLATGSLAVLLAVSSARGQSPTPAPSATLEDTGATQAVEDLSQFKTADDLWSHIQEMEHTPRTPSTTPEQVMGLLRKLSAAAGEFQTRYPEDARRWDAKLMALRYNSMLASHEGREIDPTQVESELKAVAAAPDAAKEVKGEARMNLIDMHANAAGDGPMTAAVEKEIVAFVHDFPDEPADAMFQKMRLESLRKSDSAKGAKLLAALLKDANPTVAQMAQGEVAMRDLMKKPVELQFTAVDGTKVDLKELRGKVVLVDFWATWCAPCMERVPGIVKLYKENHGKGLEVVGISLDQDKSLVKAVTLANGMVWPQYFDGKGWQNEISSRYGINSIPRMWLVNKKGMVVDAGAEEGLEEKVAKLLAE